MLCLGMLGAFLLFSLQSLVFSLPECLMDCAPAQSFDGQGHNLTDDCRCWKACEPDKYSAEAKKTIAAYEAIQAPLKKAIYVRRDCKEAVMASGDYAHIDLLLETLWAPNGQMTQKTKEQPAEKSVSAPKDWVLLHANYHCPIPKQSPYIRRQLRFYRLKTTGGRALYFHRNCERVRFVYGKATAEEASEGVLKSLRDSNQTVSDWFLYDSSKEGTCSPLTNRHREEVRDLSEERRKQWIEAMNEAYRRGFYHVHATFHGQSITYDWAHGTPGFAPWHKLAILQIEEQLRGLHPKYNCVTAPYWAWPRDCDDPMKEAGGIFTKEILGTIKSITSQKKCGVHEEGCCIKDGAFAHWKDVKGECIKRNFADMPIGKVGIPETDVLVDLLKTYRNFGYISYGKSIATFGVVSIILDACITQCGDDADEKGTCTETCHGLISTKKWRGFMGDLELTHSRVHFSVGGHMYSPYSPADPLFQLNHGFVEKVYERWQKCQGFTTLADYWVTQEDHFVDAYQVTGPYGFLDRYPGWIFTLSEGSVGRDMMYTSYDYATDQWEIDNKMNTTCPGWKKADDILNKMEEKRLLRAQLITAKTPLLDDKSSALKSIEESVLQSANLLQLQTSIDKKKSRKSS